MPDGNQFGIRWPGAPTLPLKSAEVWDPAFASRIPFQPPCPLCATLSRLTAQCSACEANISMGKRLLFYLRPYLRLSFPPWDCFSPENHKNKLKSKTTTKKPKTTKTKHCIVCCVSYCIVLFIRSTCWKCNVQKWTDKTLRRIHIQHTSYKYHKIQLRNTTQFS